MRFYTRPPLRALALLAAWPASAQIATAASPRACAGEIIVAIEIHSAPPPFTGATGVWRALADVVAEHHTVTQPRVVTAYMQLAVGQRCTERNRSESERLLRLQPYIAQASVHAIAAGPGQVRIDVETVDEVSLTAAVGMTGTSLHNLAFGSENAFGQGLALQVAGARGFAYRSGVGVSVVEYGAFNRPYTFAASAERDPVGGLWSVVFAEPFLSDLERTAFYTEAASQTELYPVIRPLGDNLAMSVRRAIYDAGAVSRVGGQRVVGVLGAALLGETANIGSDASIRSDSGLVRVPVTPDSALGGGYPAFQVTRLAAIGGIRAIHFVTVTGFDALTAAQDVGEGVQLAAIAGPSLWSSEFKKDVFVSADVYTGVGNERSFLALHAFGEGRSDRASHRWDGVVGNGRLSWYGKRSTLNLEVASLEFSEIQHAGFPVQLTFQDPDGGLPGYPSATFAGGQRAVMRFEQRRLLRPLTRADMGVSAFVDAGKLWAGDAPYGVTTTVRTSVGVSLLSSVPAGSKRMYRLDLALPLNRQVGGARWELRFSSADRTQLMWKEPADVAVARSGAPPSNLLSWSPR